MEETLHWRMLAILDEWQDDFGQRVALTGS
jgi:hypothetical protein